MLNWSGASDLSLGSRLANRLNVVADQQSESTVFAGVKVDGLMA